MRLLSTLPRWITPRPAGKGAYKAGVRAGSGQGGRKQEERSKKGERVLQGGAGAGHKLVLLTQLPAKRLAMRTSGPLPGGCGSASRPAGHVLACCGRELGPVGGLLQPLQVLAQERVHSGAAVHQGVCKHGGGVAHAARADVGVRVRSRAQGEGGADRARGRLQQRCW